MREPRDPEESHQTRVSQPQTILFRRAVRGIACEGCRRMIRNFFSGSLCAPFEVFHVDASVIIRVTIQGEDFAADANPERWSETITEDGRTGALLPDKNFQPVVFAFRRKRKPALTHTADRNLDEIPTAVKKKLRRSFAPLLEDAHLVQAGIKRPRSEVRGLQP